MKFILIMTFVFLNTSNSSFILCSTPRSTLRRVALVRHLKLCDVYNYKSCNIHSKELWRVDDIDNTTINLEEQVHHDFKTALRLFDKRRVIIHKILREKYLEKVRESNNYNHDAISTDDSPGNRSKETLDNVLKDTEKIFSPLKTSNSSVENGTDNVEIRTKDSQFCKSLEEFERRFYNISFSKLTALNEAIRPENGISFVHSGLLLWLTLIGLSTEVDKEARNEIDEHLHLNASDLEKEQIITSLITSLPTSTVDLKFNWGSRLVLRKGKQLTEQFRCRIAAGLHLKVDYFEGSESPGGMADILNRMVESDSGGTIRNTFEKEDFIDYVEDVLVNTLYLRARWRTAPTLLNGTHRFNSSDITQQTVRMIRINDFVKYARLHELNAEAIEIFYFNPDLSFLILLPNGNSLRHLAHKMSETKLETITDRMRSVRIATILPLYTLRMTLLLPNKLRAMSISRFMNTDNTTEIESLHITHAVQRLMFWAEAGRYAFKDDGMEWDEKPEREVVINRPYIFYVRWKNMTLMNGNFVL